IAADPDSAAQVLGELSADPPEARLAGNIGNIDRLFASDRLEEIIAALEAEDSRWARKELATLRTKSPLSMKVALRLIAEAKLATDFAQEMRVEYRLACRMITQPDFAEGVRAVLVDKDHAPRWNPSAPEGISEAILDAIFAPLPPDQEWTPL